MKNTDDFAIVIGISHYPRIQNLAEASSNAKAMATWLQDPSGGGLPVENITLLTDDLATHKNAIRAFNAVLLRVQQGERPRTRRFYIYMSGLGYSTTTDEVAVLMADASPELLGYSIGAKGYADFFYHSGAFEEVVLFVDCARITQFHSEPASPPFALPRRTESRPAAGAFFLFACGPSGMGAKAHPSSGVFTRALLEGLSGAATGPHGNVTSESLLEYVAKSIESLGGRQRAGYTSR